MDCTIYFSYCRVRIIEAKSTSTCNLYIMTVFVLQQSLHFSSFCFSFHYGFQWCDPFQDQRKHISLLWEQESSIKYFLVTYISTKINPGWGGVPRGSSLDKDLHFVNFDDNTTESLHSKSSLERSPRQTPFNMITKVTKTASPPKYFPNFLRENFTWMNEATF